MKMLKKLLIPLVIAFISSYATAQSKFEGFYGQVGIGYEGITPTTSNGNISISDGTSLPIGVNASSSNSFTGTITAGYMMKASDSFLIGIGAELSPFKGRKTNYSANLVGYDLGTGTYNKEISYNFFISPAAPIGSDGLLYAKFGYTGATINTVIASSSTNTNYQGYSFGLGYRQIIEGGFYSFIEANYMNYGNKTISDSGSIPGYTVNTSITTRADLYNFLIGIGYKF
jgi:hypothetical protein